MRRALRPHLGGICETLPHIRLCTLRDWEPARSQPDAAARAFLKVIVTDPQGTAAALAG